MPKGAARAKKSLGSDDFEEWFDDESWVDFLERRGDNAEATEKSTVENDYHVWHPLQIQVALDQLRLLNNNKSKVVRWFKANLPDSVFAKRLTRSHLVYWTTSRASTSAPKRKRGKKAALDENTELYKATCAFVRKHIDGALVIAFDHTGLQFMPVNNHTWAPVGAATVPLVALDDYRQITGVVAESMDDNMSGVVLGIQCVYKGKTDRCLPSRGVRLSGDFPVTFAPNQLTFNFTYTYNHWASEDTNIELFESIIVPYALNTKTRLSLDSSHPTMVILDCWPVQKTEHFRDRVHLRWPWIFLKYVPPRITGKAQKFDVDGGGIVKPKIARRATQYVEEEFTRQMREGVAAGEVRVDLKQSTLKDRQIYWVKESLVEFAANKDGRKKGWEKTRVPLAFSEDYRNRAKAMHAEGKLFPPTVLEDEEVIEEPQADDIVDDCFPDEVVQQRPTATASCTRLFEARQSETVTDSEDEGEDELEFDNMTVGSYAVTFADGKDEFAFQIKVGGQNSPWLHLVDVYSRDEGSARLKWRWWKPFAASFTSKNTRTITKGSAKDPGFHLGRTFITSPEYCKFVSEEVLVAWDEDAEDDSGIIPAELFDELSEKVRQLQKERRRTRRF
ncbi:hypothetical protein CYMTET_24335 [Cymbomonas tetramitiformis]|uniref:Uncharacterized protein n=1 Tax=Cymbomonas tetramitiformis TaxID=36881 RepID=A0AAE0FWZ0_9CHLO|nr:hypothetical protein CYMTET_24335 [Cymbomonas tetramitiformis]